MGLLKVKARAAPALAANANRNAVFSDAFMTKLLLPFLIAKIESGRPCPHFLGFPGLPLGEPARAIALLCSVSRFEDQRTVPCSRWMPCDYTFASGFESSSCA